MYKFLGIVAAIILFSSPVLADEIANFYGQHISNNKDKIIKGMGDSNCYQLSPMRSDNDSDFDLALINAAISPGNVGGLDYEALKTINSVRGKNMNSTECAQVNKLGNSSMNRKIMAHASRNGLTATRLPQGQPPKRNCVSTHPSYRLVPPQNLELNIASVKWDKNGRDNLIDESKKTTKISSSILNSIFGSGNSGIRRCIKSKDFITGVRGCRLQKSGSSCQGKLTCQLKTSNGRTEEHVIQNANCGNLCGQTYTNGKNRFAECLTKNINNGNPGGAESTNEAAQ